MNKGPAYIQQVPTKFFISVIDFNSINHCHEKGDWKYFIHLSWPNDLC